MNNWNENYRINGQTLIQQLQDRAITFSADGGIFAEAYVDANGRKNSVDTSEGSAIFNTNKYEVPDFLDDPNLVYMDIYATNVNSSIDDAANSLVSLKIDDGVWRVYSYKNSVNEALNRLFTRLFKDATTTPNYVTGLTSMRCSESDLRGMEVLFAIKARASGSIVNGDEAKSEWTQTSGKLAIIGDYVANSASNTRGNAEVQFPIATTIHTVSGATDDNYNVSDYHFDAASTGCNLRFYATNTYNPTSFDASAIIVSENTLTRADTAVNMSGATITESSVFTIASDAPSDAGFTVTHTIPSGTFADDISSAFFTFKAEEWESGADVQAQLQTPNPIIINQNSFVEISATSVVNSFFEKNNCRILPKSTGVWIVGSISSDDEVARADVYETLFYGSTSIIPAIVDGAVGVTAIKTSVARDVGKQAHYAQLTAAGNPEASLTGTFVDTSTNTDCSSWSSINDNTTFYSEFGTDLTANETDNPANCQLQMSDASNFLRWELPSATTLQTKTIDATAPDSIRALVIASGDITWVPSGSDYTSTTTDFNTDHSIPNFTSGAVLGTQFKTGYLNTNDVVSFTALGVEATEVSFKLIPKTTNPTPGFPSIQGVSLYSERPN